MARRERSGFQPLGSVELDAAAGLPARRARDLRLQRAWLVACGERLARRLHAVRVRRGTLEVAVDDDRTLAQLDDVLPVIAARTAAIDPSLGIGRFRVLRDDDRGRPRALGAPDALGPVGGRTPDERSIRRRDRARSPLDIEEVARRYLDAR